MFAANPSRLVCSALRPLCTPAESTLMFRAFPLRLRQHVLLFHVLPGMRWQGLATLVVTSWYSDSLQTACSDGCQRVSEKREAVGETKRNGNEEHSASSVLGDSEERRRSDRLNLEEAALLKDKPSVLRLRRVRCG